MSLADLSPPHISWLVTLHSTLAGLSSNDISMLFLKTDTSPSAFPWSPCNNLYLIPLSFHQEKSLSWNCLVWRIQVPNNKTKSLGLSINLVN